MSSRVRPASAMASSAASTVRSRSERPSRRPTADCPIPEITAAPLQRLLTCRRLMRRPRPRVRPVCPIRRVRRVGGVKSGSQTSSTCSKTTRTGRPTRTSLGLDADQVGRQPDVGLLVDRHPGDDVGVAPGDPLLVVDGEGLDTAAAADRLRALVARQTASADRPGRMVEEPAGVAAQQPQDAVGARGPEEGHVVAEARQETQRRAVGNHGGMLAHAHRRAPLDPAGAASIRTGMSEHVRVQSGVPGDSVGHENPELRRGDFARHDVADLEVQGLLTLVRKRVGLFLIGVAVGGGMFLIGGVGVDPCAQLGRGDGEAGAVAPADPVSVPCCAMHLATASVGVEAPPRGPRTGRQREAFHDAELRRRVRGVRPAGSRAREGRARRRLGGRGLQL